MILCNDKVCMFNLSKQLKFFYFFLYLSNLLHREFLLLNDLLFNCTLLENISNLEKI